MARSNSVARLHSNACYQLGSRFCIHRRRWHIVSRSVPAQNFLQVLNGDSPPGKLNRPSQSE